MSTQDHGTPGGEHPNRLTIEGLRQIADWLERNLDLPALSVLAHTTVGYPFDRVNPRERMTRFAELLDCRVTEKVVGDRVQIEGRINERARVMLSCEADALGGRPRQPAIDYEPITEPCAACGGLPVTGPDKDGQTETCDACEGAAVQLYAPGVTAADFDRRVA